MYECVNFSKKNIEDLKELNSLRSQFNLENEDFIDYYLSCNFAKQVLLRCRVKLLKHEEKYIGYIWFETALNEIIIKSMFSIEKEAEPYRVLISNIKAKGPVKYNCLNNEYNFNILEELGFIKNEGVIAMHLDNFQFNYKNHEEFLIENNLNFRVFRKGMDEELRCMVQNEVFQENGRIPVGVSDIYFEESQRFYFEKGSIFLFKGEECAGYAQIIIEKDMPYIVNVGILKKYQGLKYGKILMEHMLQILRECDYKVVGIRVKTSNYKALNLYKSLGFIENNHMYNLQLKR
ncbi:MAG: GNAT family N-acetyltransferase [Solirubrobacterales bacterium]